MDLSELAVRIQADLRNYLDETLTSAVDAGIITADQWIAIRQLAFPDATAPSARTAEPRRPPTASTAPQTAHLDETA